MTGATVGKIGMINKKNIPALLNQRVGKYEIIEKTKILSEFLFYIVSSKYYKEKVLSLAVGGAQPNISAKQLESIEVPLPPIEKQKEIIEKLNQKRAIIDEATSLIEKVEREKTNVQEVFDEFDCKYVQLGKIVNLKYGKGLKKGDRKPGQFAVYGSNGLIDRIDKYFINDPTIIIGRKGSCGELILTEAQSWAIDTTFFVEIIDKNNMGLKYLFYALKVIDIDKIIIKAAIPGINRDEYLKQEIPLPNLDDQSKIIELFDKKQKLIDSLKENIIETEKSMHKIIEKMFEK
jgi:type I restriction enzyme S subunit